MSGCAIGRSVPDGHLDRCWLSAPGGVSPESSAGRHLFLSARYPPPVAGTRADTMLATMSFIERFTLQRVWTGLTDEEFFWEPFPGTWSIRRREDCRTATPFGQGEWVADYDVHVAAATDWARTGEPLTNIAWLMWHFGSMAGRTAQLDFLGGTETAESGWTSPYIADHPRFTSAAEAVEALQSGWRDLRSAMQAATDEQLGQKIRFWGYPGPGPEALGCHIVASMLNEISHHGTQVCVLRDLYRSAEGRSLASAR